MSTITSILGTDQLTDSRSVINTNFSNLNTDKAETSALTSGLATKQDTITGLTASGAELNILDGATLSTTELNYVDGVTSSIQTQLNAKGVGDMVLATTQTVSGLKTFLDTTFGLRNVANTFTSFFTNTNTASRTYTLKDASGTLAFTTDITGTNSGTNTGDNATNTQYSGLAASKQDVSAKDTTGGYVGLTLFKINFNNAANTFTNFFTNATTAARTYTFPDKDITVAGLVDITGTNSNTNTGDETLASIGTKMFTATGKTTPVDADGFSIFDSAASNVLKTLTFTNLKAFLKTWIDSLTTTFTNKTIALGSNTVSGTKAQFNTANTDGDFVFLDSADTISGIKTFLSGMMGLRNVANTFTSFFTNTNTASRTYTLKDASGTLAFTTDITGTNSGTNTGNQTIANTSDATSHTATLSATGGSIKLVEGANITLTTTGTGTDGIVTIASTGGGGGLTNFTEGVNTSAPNATVPVVSLLATNAATNVDVAIVPKGTGAFTLAVADNTATGGNKRGANAIDLQKERATAARVASGTNSVAIGSENTASAPYSLAVGYANSAITTQASAVGYSAVASNTSASAFGNTSTASGNGSTSIGYLNTSSGTNSKAIGYSNTASGANTSAMGYESTAQSFGETTLGLWSTTGAGTAGSYVATDRLLVVGNGTSNGARANALVMLKNGNTTLTGTLGASNLSGTNTGDQTSIVGITGTMAQFDTAVTDGNILYVGDIVSSSTTAQGIVELATTAEINTGTDTTRAMPVDQYVASNRNVRYIDIYAIEKTTDNAVGTNIIGAIECPFTGTITEIGAYVETAGVTGVSVWDVNKNGTTIMTTNKLSIDSAEVSTRTAATAPTLTTTAITAGDLITIDTDSLSTTKPKGLHVRIGIRLT